MEDIVLDVGCGEKKLVDAIGVDIRRIVGVDVVADARYLPFKNEVFDRVYSSHTLEHISHLELKDAVKEWVRVLKPGGKLEIRCPYLRIRALIFFLNPSWKNVRNIYGEQDNAGNFHMSGFSFGLLKALLEECGITKIKRFNRGYMGIPFIPDCLHVVGTKKT